MPLLFEYLLKLSLSLGLVYLFYQFVLRRLTFYNWNRWYLLGYTLLSFCLPFVDISRTLEQSDIKDSVVISWVPVIGQVNFISHRSGSGALTGWDYVFLVLLAGALFMLVRLGLQLWSIRRMREKSTLLNYGGMRFYQVNESIIPFSFGNSIFINQEQHSSDELEEIIRHEFVHVKQKHSADIIWGELLCLLNWYNPFAWLLKRSIRQNLEYIADRQVLEQGMDRKQYQYLLLKVIGNNHFSIANQFNFSSLKKRIAMMNKFRSARFHLVKFLFILPLLSVLLLAFRNNWKEAANPGSRTSSMGNPETGTGMDTIPDKVTMPPSPPPPPVNPIQEFLKRNPDVKEAGWVFRQDNSVAVLQITKKDGTVEKINMESDEERKAAEKIYGALPYPPPPPAPAGPGEIAVAGMPLPSAPPPPPSVPGMAVPGVPLPPAAPKLPENVESIEINNRKARVSLKNGTVEQYDFTNPAEKKAFEKKYGTPLPPPPPPAMPRGVKDISIHKDNKATVFLLDGKQEQYDLSIPSEKEIFLKKYGTPPPPPPPPSWTEEAVGTGRRNSTSGSGFPAG